MATEDYELQVFVMKGGTAKNSAEKIGDLGSTAENESRVIPADGRLHWRRSDDGRLDSPLPAMPRLVL